MSDSELFAKLHDLAAWFGTQGVPIQRRPDDYNPARTRKSESACLIMLAHCHWLALGALAALVVADRFGAEKSYGFVTGVLWSMGLGGDETGAGEFDGAGIQTFCADYRTDGQTGPRQDLPAGAQVPAVSH